MWPIFMNLSARMSRWTVFLKFRPHPTFLEITVLKGEIHKPSYTVNLLIDLSINARVMNVSEC